jgi:hypothetical protein
MLIYIMGLWLCASLGFLAGCLWVASHSSDTRVTSD